MQVLKNNLPNNGLCPCGYPIGADGVCTNPNCPTADAYTAGYRSPVVVEQYPVEDDLD